MDAQPSLARVAGLTALVQGIARHAVEAPARDELSDDVLAVNDHRAAHGGLGPARRGRGRRRCARCARWRTGCWRRRGRCWPATGSPLRSTSSTRCWRGPDEPARQRHLHATGGMPALLADLVARTADLDG